jgi:SAM-dependent methyltransferase
MEKLFIADLDRDDLSELPDAHFDVIVMSHVIEHVWDGLPAVARLTKKLAPGGRIYIEFPSVRSLASRRRLGFCDYPTHVRVYDVKEVANVLLANGLKVITAGRRREWLRVALFPLAIPSNIKTLLSSGRLTGAGLWDLCGLADFVYAEMPSSGNVSIHQVQAVGGGTSHYDGRRYPFKLGVPGDPRSTPPEACTTFAVFRILRPFIARFAPDGQSTLRVGGDCAAHAGG